MKKIEMTDAILIVFLTAISYFAFFRYQTGYYNYFNIPDFLVDVSMPSILKSILPMLLLIVSIYMIYTPLYSLIFSLIPSGTHPHIIVLIEKYILYFVYLIFLFMLNGLKDKLVINLFLFLLILTIIFDIILPLYTQRKTKGYINRIIAEIDNQVKHSKSINSKNLINSVCINNIPLVAIIILVFLLVSTFSYNLGETNAKNQKTFNLINNELVILGTYKDNFIVKEIDLIENALEPEFSLIQNKEDYKYIRKEIENLVVKD